MLTINIFEELEKVLDDKHQRGKAWKKHSKPLTFFMLESTFSRS